MTLRVVRVIEEILLSEDLGAQVTEEDQQYLINLGLIRMGATGLEITNPIYREVIPRQLTLTQEKTLDQDPVS